MPAIPDDNDLEAGLEEPGELAPQGFSDLVREHPIGAVIGAFIAGLLIARLI